MSTEIFTLYNCAENHLGNAQHTEPVGPTLMKVALLKAKIRNLILEWAQTPPNWTSEH